MADEKTPSKPWSTSRFRSSHQSEQKAGTRPSSTSSPRDENNEKKLREYETRRRLAYTSKYDTMSLHWKSYRDLLSASLAETGLAQRLVLGTCHSHLLYANAMQAMHDDVFLDEKGNVANEKLQKRLSTIRQQKKTTNNNKTTCVVTEVKDTQKELAERFGESAKAMDGEIGGTITSLLEDLKRQHSAVERLGSAILEELDKTEQEVTVAWGKYISKSLNNGTAQGGLLASSATSPQETAPKTGENADTWIVEMQYRVAVAYQNAAWEKGSKELNNLFERVKQEECLRRMNLRSFLVAFVQRQQRLFLSLPGLPTAALERLVAKEMTFAEMERSVQTAIEAQAAKYKNHNISSSSDPSTNKQQQLGVELESPLISDLLSKAKVVERRGAGLNNNPGWTTSLAIMTGDSYLHLFDINNEGSTKILPGAEAEVALQALMPPVLVPTKDSLSLGKSNFSKGWSDTLTPSDSFVLGNCTIKTKDDTTFELSETVTVTGASKMFGKSSTKRVQIRTPSKSEAEDWIAILTA